MKTQHKPVNHGRLDEDLCCGEHWNGKDGTEQEYRVETYLRGGSLPSAKEVGEPAWRMMGAGSSS